MRNLLLSTLLIFGYAQTSHAAESVLPTLPINMQISSSSSESSESEVTIESTSRYCCIREGGTYCDMGYYDTFGQPCQCHTGNNIYHGHVCR